MTTFHKSAEARVRLGHCAGMCVAFSALAASVPADPALVHEAQLFGHIDHHPQAGAQFGCAVAVSGDTAVVGAPHDDVDGALDVGSAYVFVRSGTGWVLQQKLIPDDGAAGDFFGISVSLTGDTAVVGARLHDTVAGADAGTAYVFVRSGTAWTLQQKLSASDGAAGDSFGTSVSVSGGTLVVGAPVADTSGGVDAGAAYAFVRSGTTWTEQQKIVPPDARANEDFGFSAALSGDSVVIGAPSDDILAGFNAGSAYVFVRSGTSWSLQQKLLSSHEAGGDAFGFSVSISGDTVVVGAFADDTGPDTDAGSAYVFVRAGPTWTEQQRLAASDAATGDYFGFAVSVSGDAALVGALLHETPAGVDAGAAYVFARSGTSWSARQRLVAPKGMGADAFGYAVALATDTAVVGVPDDDTPGGLNAGSAHVFRGSVPVGLPPFNGE